MSSREQDQRSVCLTSGSHLPPLRQANAADSNFKIKAHPLSVGRRAGRLLSGDVHRILSVHSYTLSNAHGTLNYTATESIGDQAHANNM